MKLGKNFANSIRDTVWERVPDLAWNQFTHKALMVIQRSVWEEISNQLCLTISRKTLSCN